MRKPHKARNLLGAWKAGFVSAFSGLPMSHCPYLDRKHEGHVTFSRAFLRYWCDGWRAGKSARDEHVTQQMKERQRSLFDAFAEEPHESHTGS